MLLYSTTRRGKADTQTSLQRAKRADPVQRVSSLSLLAQSTATGSSLQQRKEGNQKVKTRHHPRVWGHAALRPARATQVHMCHTTGRTDNFLNIVHKPLPAVVRQAAAKQLQRRTVHTHKHTLYKQKAPNSCSASWWCHPPQLLLLLCVEKPAAAAGAGCIVHPH